MTRPDIAALREEDLIQAANAGLLKRAKKELAEPTLTAQVQSEGNDIVVRWSDGIDCRFPPGSSLRGSCSCPASEVCRHLIRSVLLLQSRSDDLTEEAPAADAGATAAETVAQLVALPRPAFARKIGRANLARGERFLAENEATVVDADGGRVRFGRRDWDVLLLPTSAWENGICGCGAPPPCDHLIAALLVLRGETATAAPAKGRSLDEAVVSACIHRCRDLLDELILAGLDGLSPAWTEAARTTALEIEKGGLPVPARLLGRIAESLDAERSRTRPFRPASLRWDLAALWLRLNPAPSSSIAERNAEESVRSTELLERKRTLIGLGIRAWQTSEVSGITLYLLDETSGEIATVGTGRPIDLEITPSQLAQRAEMMGPFVGREIVGHRVEVSAARMVEGKLRLAHGAGVDVSAQPVDWEHVSAVGAVLRWSDLADRLGRQFPTLRSLQAPDTLWFRPARWGKARVELGGQRLIWPMYDESDWLLPLHYRYEPERQDSFAELQKLAEKETPIAVFGQIRWQGGPPRVEPITLLTRRDRAVHAFMVDIDRIEERSGSGRRKTRRAP